MTDPLYEAAASFAAGLGTPIGAAASRETIPAYTEAELRRRDAIDLVMRLVDDPAQVIAVASDVEHFIRNGIGAASPTAVPSGPASPPEL
jgi:hypothetical protein